MDCFLAIIAILFPPLPVWVKRGICSADSIINIALCVLGFLPGLLHAWYIIGKYPDIEYGYSPVDQEAQRYRGRYACHRQQSCSNRRQQPPRQEALVHSPVPPSQQEGYGSFNGGVAGAQGSSSQGAGEPPSYASVVKGDNKIQSP